MNSGASVRDVAAVVRPAQQQNPSGEAVRSAYIHIPFCQQRCGYCDFAILTGRSDLVPRYLRALERELAATFSDRTTPAELETLYIGGGTPTLLSVEELRQFLDLLERYFQVIPDGEFTFEANPDLFSEAKQDLLASAGVNRISLGVQSLDDTALVSLERTHSAAEAIAVFRQIGARFGNVSLDLIFALPGQTLAHWRETLERVLSLQPNHISTYALTFEKGTRFWGERHRGTLQAVADSIEAEMYELVTRMLPSAGWEQYEISNFARPGFHSRHNDVYWRGLPFWAFGPGAARFIGGERTVNHRSPYTWMKRVEAGESPVVLIDRLTPEERARELFAIGLRRTAGIDTGRIEQQTGINLPNLLTSEIDRLQNRGWLEPTATGFRLTPAGRMFADEIAAIVI